ncbi:CaiB/BaiF CoA transferase family protein [Kribbia dieselivorans]|uniref:CaiB/BaiF CoA transferase family protein n=1 Tax=Kribbia dieselivorans TaxID=331526 RepID=UPI000A874FA2|nr:CaiB/BaiF CoA-transferase family protein [Kribbia dieselivorans]
MLKDLRVIEVAQLAPSSVGGHLADLGAEVIKVESGPVGDGVRVGGFQAVGGPDGPAFMHLRWNRGKKSICLDLRTDVGRAAFLDLAKEADVVIEGLRSGYLEWLGIGPEVLAEVNPKLVFCGISGYGAGGPYSSLGSGGPVFDGYAGLRDVELPDDAPTRGMAGGTAPTIGMYAMGAYGAMAVLAAVHEARNTGRGRSVEVSGVDVTASWIPDQIDATLNVGRTVQRPGWLPDGRLPDWPRLEAYRTKDGGAILFVAHVEKFWRTFCRAVGREELADVDLMTIDEGTVERGEYVWSQLREIFATRTRAEWMEIFQQHDIAGGPVNTVADLIVDPHFTARRNTYRSTVRGVDLDLMVSPVRAAGEEFAPAPAPELGADTRDVLATIAGYDETAIQAADATPASTQVGTDADRTSNNPVKEHA